MTGNVRIYNIFVYLKANYKPSTSKQIGTKELMNYFASNIGNTSWSDILSSYYQVNYGTKQYASRNISFVKSINWHFNNTGQTSVVTYRQIITYLVAVFNGAYPNSVLPVDPNGIYMFIFKSDMPSDPNTCGYHFSFSSNSLPNIKVGVVYDPYNPTTGQVYLGCALLNSGSPNKDLSGDNMVTTYAHELAESITNFNNNAWYQDSSQMEIADLCNFNPGDYSGNSNIVVGKKSFLIQQLWVRNIGCAMSLHPPGTGAPTESPSQVGGGHSGGGGSGNGPTCQPVFFPTRSPALPLDVSYHGGFINGLSSGGTALYNVFVGDLKNSTVHLIDYFARNIGDSNWFKVLTSYYEMDGGNTFQYVNNQSVFYGNTAAIYPLGKNLTLGELDIQNIIYQAILNEELELDSNGIYMVMFRGDFNVSVNGKQWLRDWCSYHGSFALQSGDEINFAVIGDPSTAPGTSGRVCEPISNRPTANEDLGADSMAMGYAQQLANCITDSRGQWYSDVTGLEAGTSCYSDFGPIVNLTDPKSINYNVHLRGRSFFLQSLWQPGYGCTMTKVANNDDSIASIA